MADALRDWTERIPTPYRAGYLRALRGQGSPRAAIKAKCLECCAWERKVDGVDRIGACTVRLCPLWAFRPFRQEDEVQGV